MTNKEALLAVIRFSIPDNSAEKALVDNDVDGTANYSKDAEKSIDLCAVDALQGLLSEPDVSEGGYSVKYDRKAVQDRLLYLAKKHNLTEVLNQYTPIIKSSSPW